MGCKYSKVIPKNKREERTKSAKRRKAESNKLDKAVDAKKRELSTEEILDDLYVRGIVKNPKKSVGGVAFDIGQTDLPPRPPRRLEAIKPKEDYLYTAEEKALIVEIVREDNLDKEREKGWKRDLKHDKAKSRRMLKETETKAKVENKRKRYDQRMDEMDKKFMD